MNELIKAAVAGGAFNAVIDGIKVFSFGIYSKDEIETRLSPNNYKVYWHQ